MGGTAGGGRAEVAGRLKGAHRGLFGLFGLVAAELHGNLTQLQRLEALEAFRDGKVGDCHSHSARLPLPAISYGRAREKEGGREGGRLYSCRTAECHVAYAVAPLGGLPAGHGPRGARLGHPWMRSRREF